MAMTMKPKILKDAPCQTIVHSGPQVDLYTLPIQTCWPLDTGPLITWGLVTTSDTPFTRHNNGIYRMQVITKNKLIVRWLPKRGGALDYLKWQQINPNKPFKIAVALGAEPATSSAAVTPIPDTLSEYTYSAILSGHKTELVKALSQDLLVSA